jgi:hypothetical protein
LPIRQDYDSELHFESLQETILIVSIILSLLDEGLSFLIPRKSKLLYE